MTEKSDPIPEEERSQTQHDPHGSSSSYEELSDEELESVAGGWDGDDSGDGGG